MREYFGCNQRGRQGASTRSATGRKEGLEKRHIEFMPAPPRAIAHAWFKLVHITGFVVAGYFVVYLADGVPKRVRSHGWVCVVEVKIVENAF